MNTNSLKTSLVAFFLFSLSFSFAQVFETIAFNASTTNVQDAPLSYRNPNNNYGSVNEMNVYTWTEAGNLNINRVVLNFDLSALPLGSTIIDAQLILYFKPTNAGVLTEHSGMNNYLVHRIVSEWKEETVTWNNQPSITLENAVEVPPTTNPTQNTVVEVTDLVQDMIDDPVNSFGFLLKFLEEEPYKACLYASSDHADLSLHPELIVTYLRTSNVDETPLEQNLIVFPNPTSSQVTIENRGAAKISRMVVRNVLGQFIREVSGEVSELSFDQTGVYLVEIHTSAGVEVKTVVVQ